MLIKLLIGSLILLVACFIALVWLVANLLHITLWLPAGVTVFFVLAAICLVLFKRVRASDSARGLEQALAAQAKEHARVVRPDMQDDVLQMQEEFDKAIAALKSAKLGPGGSSALYFLPWYAIIGPPGAGKSTALRSSGLHFPYTSGSGGPAVKGLGGTRNCDWWLTNEAVVLDTAGRWSTQDEDREEWLAFLGLLKRYRPRKPLNGLIAAISVGDVVNAREDEVEALAQRMRARLDEVQAQLRVSMPVYVLFTKADLVEGFLETFSDLRRGERNQVWGFTVPLAKRSDDAGAAFRSRFDELSEVLERRSFGRMADERSVERRTAIYAFPQQFAALRRNLDKFVSVMFQRNIYEATPSLRGVYFTSGTQEGRPFNLLMNRLVEGMGIRRKAEVSEPVFDQKSYFLHDVFMNVIFEDRDVASASEVELKRQRRRRNVFTAALAAVSLTVGLIPGYAWSRNKRQLSAIEAAVQQWEAPGRKPLDAKATLARLEPLRALVNTLLDNERQGAPLSMRLGMYQQDQLVSPLRRYYANLLRRELVQPLVQRDTQRMADFGLRYASLDKAHPTDQEQAEMYDLLKLHLDLTLPKQRGEPPFEPTQRPWVEGQLRSRWLASLDKESPLQAAVQVDAGLYTAFMREFPDLAFPRDKEVVQRVRAALTRVPATTRALSQLVARADAEGFDLTLYHMIGASNAFHDAGARVRGAFTRRGWENVIRDALTVQILEDAGELWVLGLADQDEPRAQQREAQLAELRSAYFEAYIEAWQNFLRRQRVEAASSHAASLELLRELTRGVPPSLSLLLHKVYYNTQLKPKPSVAAVAKEVGGGAIQAVEQAVAGLLSPEQAKHAKRKIDKLAPSHRDDNLLSETDVARAFENIYAFAVPPDTGDDGPKVPVPFDAYNDQLIALRDALQVYLDDPSESEQLMKRLQDARVRVRGMIEQQPAGVRPLFEAWLWPPVAGAVTTTSSALANTASDAWCNAVVSEYDRTIAGRYPFHRDGQDLPLADFANFYRPHQGKLWAFIEGPFSKAVELDGDRYVFPRKLGQNTANMYSHALLEFLERSRDITQSYFPTHASQPSMEFDVKVQPSPDVATTQFQIGGKSVDYYNGPEQWKTLTWPGDNPVAGAAIVIRGANGMQERIRQDGPWGLFRLIEAGTLLPAAGRTFTIAWQLQTHDVTLKIDFRPKRGESPFFGVPGRSARPVFMQPVRAQGVAAPNRIVASGRACPGGHSRAEGSRP